MIEQQLIDYLKSNSIEVYAEEQESHSANYVVIELNDTEKENGVNHAFFDTYIYSTSMLNTATLAAQIVDLLMSWSFNNSKNISECKINSLYNDTDTESKKYRYKADIEILYL